LSKRIIPRSRKIGKKIEKMKSRKNDIWLENQADEGGAGSGSAVKKPSHGKRCVIFMND
jgi:hypothetical protein